MLPDTCPRCGLPHSWSLRLPVRRVLTDFTLAFTAGLVAGRTLR